MTSDESALPIQYVDETDDYMSMARLVAARMSLDIGHPVGAVVVDREGVMLGVGANGSSFHAEQGCIRKQLGCASGVGYHLCAGCSPLNHAEVSALRRCKDKDAVRGGSLYLWGHYWCCDDCCREMRAAGIERVYLLRDADKLFA